MTWQVDGCDVVTAVRKQFCDPVELARPSIPTVHEEDLGAVVWNPIHHDFLAHGFGLYFLLLGLGVIPCLSGWDLEFDWSAEDFPKKSCGESLGNETQCFRKGREKPR